MKRLTELFDNAIDWLAALLVGISTYILFHDDDE